MKLSELVRTLRELDTESLEKRIVELKKELFNLRSAVALKTQVKPHRIREIKREIARIKTIIREREKPDTP